MKPARSRPHPPQTYEFQIKGHLDNRWANWFEGLTLTRETDGTTTLRGAVIDQAALHGVLHKLHDLGMTLISMHAQDDSEL